MFSDFVFAAVTKFSKLKRIWLGSNQFESNTFFVFVYSLDSIAQKKTLNLKHDDFIKVCSTK